MKERILNTIKKYNMLCTGDKVIVALSGGPDSVCLLHVLSNLKDELGISIYAVHVNHCLRGEDANLDEDYAREISESLSVPFFSKRINVHKLCEETGLSCEAAGRKARYDFFDEVASEVGANKIALAHNYNDQAETVLMRIMRGAGLEGLVGIRPVRDNKYIRPIIEINRRDIEAYCDEFVLNPRIDKTNLENIYSRNKVRLELIPYIEENFNSDIISTLNRTSSLIRVENDFLENLSLEKYKKYCDTTGKTVIIKSDMFMEHEAIINRVLRHTLKEVVGDLNNFESTHINEVINIQKLSTGKRCVLPRGVIVENVYGNIHVYVEKEKSESNRPKEYILPINEEVYIEAIDAYIKASLVKKGSFKRSKDEDEKYLAIDDKEETNILLRYPKEGDVFTPLGMKGSKKLNRFFIDNKVPREERNNKLILCIDNEIAWIIGDRISNKFKVTEESNKILRVEIRRGNNDI
ncbi:tRNA(Ile)-lysidine synthase [Clostridium collagenovorans DSM 3089]|uniref:tRNA(Ile)-lysidine synthase n=1 Tax=Clostridium collagenovorans DSM 3089 TaxID=1121306 RepID=A0A1M5Y7J9_9CLOT|nr:tRNA lysidine(34) synthetase TilS [Clostridium collagenovorans]SHI07956.1 tRNA(Ile)-lysidine synthase [Clostridium collagenovorans DSM 3089]